MVVKTLILLNRGEIFHYSRENLTYLKQMRKVTYYPQTFIDKYKTLAVVNYRVLYFVAVL
jgi:hypothetical protein